MPEPLTPATTSVAAAATTPATTDAGQPAKGNKTAAVAKTDDAIVATLGTYKVAPGRHLVHGEDHVYENGAIKKFGRTRDYAPGDEIELDEADAERFLKTGFILDKDGSIVVRADGPAVNVEDGVQVRGA